MFLAYAGFATLILFAIVAIFTAARDKRHDWIPPTRAGGVIGIIYIIALTLLILAGLWEIVRNLLPQ